MIPLGLWARSALAASEIVLFQHALAHADYTAAPLPIWPDSPAAEAIENLVSNANAAAWGLRPAAWGLIDIIHHYVDPHRSHRRLASRAR